jgi:hypothetical protein
MTSEQMDLLTEAYLTATHCLVTGRGGLRARLREAAAVLQKCRDLGDLLPANEFEYQLIEPLGRLLDLAGKLDGMKRRDLEDFAWDIWRAQAEVNNAVVHRVGVQWGDVTPW